MDPELFPLDSVNMGTRSAFSVLQEFCHHNMLVPQPVHGCDGADHAREFTCTIIVHMTRVKNDFKGKYLLFGI